MASRLDTDPAHNDTVTVGPGPRGPAVPGPAIGEHATISGSLCWIAHLAPQGHLPRSATNWKRITAVTNVFAHFPQRSGQRAAPGDERAPGDPGPPGDRPSPGAPEPGRARAGRVLPGRAQRPARDHRHLLDRARPGAGRDPVLPLPGRGRGPGRRAQPVPGHGLQERPGRPGPRRRQGGDHRRPAPRTSPRRCCAPTAGSSSRWAAATSPPATSAPTARTWTSSPASAGTSPAGRCRTAAPATPRSSPRSACSRACGPPPSTPGATRAWRPPGRRGGRGQGRPPPGGAPAARPGRRS